METLIQFGLDYGLFLAKAITVVIAVGFLAGLIANSIKHAREMSTDHLEVRNLNERLDNMKDVIESQTLNKAQAKLRKKAQKAAAKAKKKIKQGDDEKHRLYVLDFEGDIRAAAVAHLREEISAILQVASDQDEVLIRLESAGGMVHGYGLAASQIRRLKDAGIYTTVAIDKVAASGGYLMACVAQNVIAAPFAIIGSIGVVAQLPNFNRLLKQHNIDFELHTAGEYKRTLTLFGENTEEGRAKFLEELEETHQLFKAFVTENRPRVDIDQVATGEHWYGSKALEFKLVDRVQTSDDYLLAAAKDKDLYQLQYKSKKSLSEKIAGNISKGLKILGYTRTA